MARIRRREITFWPPPAPGFNQEDYHFADVYATAFTYHQSGELWMVTNQFWREEFCGDVSQNSQEPSVLIREFRGSGRARYMVRDRDPADFKNILHDTAIWTDYDGVSPMGDWTVDETTGVITNMEHIALGVAEFDHATGTANYMHGDQIGSTRMETLAGAVDGVVTYTAFGEPVTESGNVGTRYRYAGGWGYENFDGMDWGTPTAANTHEFEFPYLHVGARYYDPGTGRFLQRDPIGIDGGLNVFEYTSSSPTTAVDPTGNRPIFDPPRFWGPHLKRPAGADCACPGAAGGATAGAAATGGKVHTKGKRKSTKPKHEKGQARRKPHKAKRKAIKKGTWKFRCNWSFFFILRCDNCGAAIGPGPGCRCPI